MANIRLLPLCASDNFNHMSVVKTGTAIFMLGQKKASLTLE
ncbi:MAG: hypothetical protein ABIP37_06155 [Methylotenera sp.]